MSVITLAKLTEEIAGHLHRELDEPFKRMLAEKIDHWRGRLLRNSLQERPAQSKFFRQTVFLRLEKQDVLDSCLKTSAPICPVLRTVDPVPTPLRFGVTLFDYIGSVNGSNNFREAPVGTLAVLGAGKYSKGLTFYRYGNDHVEILNAHSLPLLRLDAVFDRPTEAMRLHCQATGCDFWEEPYPVTSDIAQMIVQSILQTDFNRPVTPEDRETLVNTQNAADGPQK